MKTGTFFPHRRELLAVGGASLLVRCASAQTTGRFLGPLLVEMLDDGRNVRLTAPFGYEDPVGKRWDVPSGEQTDGASVPRFFWQAYPPFTGQYRRAAVIHDYFCRTEGGPSAPSASWKAVHAVFYDAMLTAGVSAATAKLLWAAVYNFGPRWGLGVRSRGPGAVQGATIEDERAFMERAKDLIAARDPTLDQLADAIDSRRL